VQGSVKEEGGCFRAVLPGLGTEVALRARGRLAPRGRMALGRDVTPAAGGVPAALGVEGTFS